MTAPLVLRRYGGVSSRSLFVFATVSTLVRIEVGDEWSHFVRWALRRQSSKVAQETVQGTTQCALRFLGYCYRHRGRRQVA